MGLEPKSLGLWLGANQGPLPMLGAKKQKMPMNLQESALVLPRVVGDGAGMNLRSLTQLLQDLR